VEVQITLATPTFTTVGSTWVTNGPKKAKMTYDISFPLYQYLASPSIRLIPLGAVNKANLLPKAPYYAEETDMTPQRLT